MFWVMVDGRPRSAIDCRRILGVRVGGWLAGRLAGCGLESTGGRVGVFVRRGELKLIGLLLLFVL